MHLNDLQVLVAKYQELNLGGACTESPGAGFLGPKAENEKLFTRLVVKAIEKPAKDLRAYFLDDPVWVTDDVKASRNYKISVKQLEGQFEHLLDKLGGSVPFFSYRSQVYMLMISGL